MSVFSFTCLLILTTLSCVIIGKRLKNNQGTCMVNHINMLPFVGRNLNFLCSWIIIWYYWGIIVSWSWIFGSWWAPIVVLHVPDIVTHTHIKHPHARTSPAAPQCFPRGLKNMSLFLQNENHAYVHVWEREVE